MNALSLLSELRATGDVLQDALEDQNIEAIRPLRLEQIALSKKLTDVEEPPIKTCTRSLDRWRFWLSKASIESLRHWLWELSKPDWQPINRTYKRPHVIHEHVSGRSHGTGRDGLRIQQIPVSNRQAGFSLSHFSAWPDRVTR